MKKSLILPLLALLAMTGCRQDELPQPETGHVHLTLDLQPQQPVAVTRSVDENILTDANLFVYRQGESEPFAHLYTDKPYFVIDIVPDVYTFYVVGNLHRDMGPLTRQSLVDFSDYAIDNGGTLVMAGQTTENIDFSTYLLELRLYRKAARIAYNVKVAQPAVEMGITLLSAQLCNLPDRAPLYEPEGSGTEGTSYHAGEEQAAEAGAIELSGTRYMFPNCRGEVPSIATQDRKNRANAPANASYLRIRAQKAGAALEYIIYLGANNTTDFNVRQNEAHTYDVTIWSDTRTDTRITRYLLECDDRWPAGRYLDVSDKGELAYAVENTTDHTLTGRLTVRQGVSEVLTIKPAGASNEEHAPYEFPVAANGSLELTYTPTLIREGKNSRLEYVVELADETGRSVAYPFAHEFANRVDVYNPTGTSIDQITVGGALGQTRTTDKVEAWCYEGGCELTIAGEGFEGWFADAEFVRKLSADRTYRYIPTTAESRVYAKFKLPETTIRSNETAKNSTYMNNVNQVELTVADYTGPVTVKAVCERGGLFTSGATQTITVEAGQTATLAPIQFVPVKTGNVSYTIEVYTTDGQKIGSTVVTNTITATKLTPNIRVYYDSPAKQGSFPVSGGEMSWYGYNRVCADVSFTPALDYPAPLDGKKLLQIELFPKCAVTEIDEHRDDVWGSEYSSLTEENITDLVGTFWFESFETEYPTHTDFSTYVLMDIETYHRFGDDRFYRQGAVFNPYTQGLDYLILPPYNERYTSNIFGRIFIYYYFSRSNVISDSEIQISNLYEGSDIQLETDYRFITITNNL